MSLEFDDAAPESIINKSANKDMDLELCEALKDFDDYLLNWDYDHSVVPYPETTDQIQMQGDFQKITPGSVISSSRSNGISKPDNGTCKLL